jgi:hypothetical protein
MFPGGLAPAIHSGKRRLPLAALLTVLIPHALHALPEAADPHAPVPRPQYQPVIKGYLPFRPVDPADWRNANDRVAPKPKTEQRDNPQR